MAWIVRNRCYYGILNLGHPHKLFYHLIYTLITHNSQNSLFLCMGFLILEEAWKLVFSMVCILDFL